MGREIPWNWLRPGPERDKARARDKRRREAVGEAARLRAASERRAVTLAERDAEIRRLWGEGWEGIAIARRFGLAKSTVSGIVAGLPSRRRHGDPEDVSWPYPRRHAPRPPGAPRAARRFEKAGPPDPADALGGYAVAPRGSDHGRAVLDEAGVVEMRRLRSEGVSTGEIAHRFGVSRNTACYAINGTTWGHVPGAIKSKGGKA